MRHFNLATLSDTQHTTSHNLGSGAMRRLLFSLPSSWLPNIHRHFSHRQVTWPRKFSSLSSLLKKDQISIVEDEKLMFDELFASLKLMEASQDDLDLIRDCRSRVDDFFMVIVVGEFNAGKSTFINALLGEKYLKDGVLPTTSKIGILRKYTDGNVKPGIWRKADNLLLNDVEELDLPLDWLDHVAIIDTPGTNAVIVKHESLTQKIVPRSDLVVFVTSAERPISESESTFLSKISQWGKKVVVVINKIDILTDPKERAQVLDYVTQHVSQILGSARPVPVFCVSGRNALNSKLAIRGGDPSMGPGARLWLESGLKEIEDYFRAELGKESLIKNKLENPLVVADRIIADALVVLEKRSAILESDLRVVEMIDENMAAFDEDLERDVRYYRQHIQSVLQRVVDSADGFLEENVSIFKPQLLLDTKKFQEEFKR